MVRETLGRLANVPLGDHWPDETRDFTPWLAEADNIAILADAIGIDELEVEEVERALDRSAQTSSPETRPMAHSS